VAAAAGARPPARPRPPPEAFNIED